MKLPRYIIKQNLPHEQYQADRRHLSQHRHPQHLGNHIPPPPPDPLTHRQRQQHAQTQLLRDVGIHVAEGARVRGPPVVKRAVARDEAVDEDGREEGAGRVADDDGDDGRGLVAAGGARHDDVGGDCRREAGRREHAEDDGRGGRAVAEGAGCEADVDEYWVLCVVS